MLPLNVLREIHENAVRRWNEAKDWVTLLNLNKEFLQLCLNGRENIATPYKIGSLSSDKVPLIPSLIQLHDFGLLTTASKPAFVTEPEYIRESHKWSQFEQLSYLDFLVFYDGVATDTLFDALLSDSRLLVRITDFRYDPPTFLNGSYAECLGITYKREAVSKEQLLSINWTAKTGWGPNPAPLQETFLDGMKATLTQNLLWCQVTSEDEADVVEVVKEHAIKSSM